MGARRTPRSERRCIPRTRELGEQRYVGGLALAGGLREVTAGIDDAVRDLSLLISAQWLSVFSNETSSPGELEMSSYRLSERTVRDGQQRLIHP